MSEKKRKKTAPPSPTPSQRTAKVSGDPMDLGLLEQMVKLMSQHDLSTVDVRSGDKRIVLRRGAQYVAGPMPQATYAPPAAPVAAPSASVPAAAPASPAGSDASADAGLIPVKSPMVGTFYAAPSPDAKPFVSVGTPVDEDTDVCVIEAMKVFNNIKAETRGTIAKINVTNGQTVEFGQVLFLVKP